MFPIRTSRPGGRLDLATKMELGHRKAHCKSKAARFVARSRLAPPGLPGSLAGVQPLPGRFHELHDLLRQPLNRPLL